jgi:hypothetical protein
MRDGTNEPPRRRAAGYQAVIPESPKGLSGVRHARHPALGHELWTNAATSKGNLDSRSPIAVEDRLRGNDTKGAKRTFYESIKIGILIVLIFGGCLRYSTENVEHQNNPMKLWYQKPAQVWEEALPIGNGRLGAIVLGNGLLT